MVFSERIVVRVGKIRFLNAIIRTLSGLRSLNFKDKLICKVLYEKQHIIGNAP